MESMEKGFADAYTTIRDKLDELVGEQNMTLVKELLRLEPD